MADSGPLEKISFDNTNDDSFTMALPDINDDEQTEIEDESEIIDSSGPWNKRIQLILKSIGDIANAYAYMHEIEADHYTWMRWFFSIIEVILGTILAALTGSTFISVVSSSSFLSSPVPIAIITVIQICFIAAIAITHGVKEAGAYVDRMYNHNYCISRFNKITYDIKSQFALPLEKREKDDTYMTKMIDTFVDLLETTPKIRSKTKKKYLKDVDLVDDMIKPLTLGGLSGIKIVADTKKIRETHDNTSDNIDEEIEYQLNRWIRRL